MRLHHSVQVPLAATVLGSLAVFGRLPPFDVDAPLGAAVWQLGIGNAQHYVHHQSYRRIKEMQSFIQHMAASHLIVCKIHGPEQGPGPTHGPPRASLRRECLSEGTFALFFV